MRVRVKKRLKHALWRVRAYLLAYLRSVAKSRELHAVQDNTRRVADGDILLICTLRNEAVRIPFFLEYYRKLGVDHFLFVDNGSTDGFMDLVRGAEDISVWHTGASYKASNYGVHWMNGLMRRYGAGHWSLTVDPDEFLVYPYCETRSLKMLAEHLEEIEKESLGCVMLDMCGENGVEGAAYRAGQDPLEVCPWYDGEGYWSWFDEVIGTTWIGGGCRGRVFNREQPVHAPAINKIPFIKAKRRYLYLLSTHSLLPAYLNSVHYDKPAVTGCLLHFKFLSTLKEKVAEEMRRREHFDGGREYAKYNEVLTNEDVNLMGATSVRYESPRELVERGMMTTGDWF